VARTVPRGSESQQIKGHHWPAIGVLGAGAYRPHGSADGEAQPCVSILVVKVRLVGGCLHSTAVRHVFRASQTNL